MKTTQRSRVTMGGGNTAHIDNRNLEIPTYKESWTNKSMVTSVTQSGVS